MSPDAEATVRSAFSLLSSTSQVPSATSAVYQQDVESSSISNGATYRKRSHKAVPPISEDVHPSTGRRISSHRRTRSISSMETIRGKPSRSPSKSTDCHANATKASTSRKASKDRLKLASNRAVVPAKRPAHGQSDADMSFVRLDVTLCDIDVDRDGPDMVASTAPSQSAESSRKNLDELWSAPKQTKTKEESKASESSARTKVSPLQDLSLNTELKRPLVRQLPPLTPPGIEWSIVTTGGATENKFGCVQLSAAELAMEITFYQKPHFEVWDMPDSAHVHWPAQVNLIVNNSARWAQKPLLLPDIRMLDIQCCTKERFSVYSEFDTEASHSVCYTGARLQDDQGKPLPLVHENGITIEPEWVRSYGKTIGKGGTSNERGIGIGKRGWYLKIWVPIPMTLFVKRETRTFVLRACVWIGGDDGDFVESKGEMTVSHLRREREMI